MKFDADTRLLLQYTNAKDKRVTDFGIPALNGRPVDVPANIYYGSSRARDDDTSTSLVSTYSAVLEHSFNDALKVRNATRFYDYQLDRFNTLSNGNTNAAARSVQLSRSAIFRKESGWFNQTDFNYKTTFGGMKHEILFGAELGQQKNGWRLCRREYSPPCPFLTPGVVTPPAFTAAQLNANPAIASNTVQDVFGLYVLNQITLAKNWKALVGIRFDQFKQDTNFEKTLAPLARVDSNYSPRAGLVWQPGDSQSYYVSYSRSYQPSAESFALALNSAANAPEVTRNLEVGTKRLSGRCAKCQCCTV